MNELVKLFFEYWYVYPYICIAIILWDMRGRKWKKK